MDNNIRTLEKDLRAFAKRNKNVTYTKGLLMTFLITGTISLSAWGAISSADYANYNAGYAVSAISTGQIYGGPAINPAGNGLGAVYINLAETQNSDGNATAAEKTLNIVGQASKFGDTQLIGQTASSVSKEIEGVRKNIDTSISSIKTDFKTFKAENNRLLKASNLELIQLMEQGDHVVKSPWSSWQYGVNFFYGDYRGAYKGRGDKAEKYPYEGVFTRSEDVFERNTSPLSNSYSKLNTGSDPYSALSSQRKGLSAGYGIGSVKREQEPLVSAKAEVAIIPRIITKNPINVVTPAMTEPNPTTPNIAIKQPKSISVVTPTSPAVNPELPTPNASPFANYCFTGCGNYVTRNMSKNSSGQYVSPDPDYIGRGESLWAGVDINGNPVDGAGSTIATSQETNIGTYTYDSFPKTVGNRKINRPGIVVYLNDSGYVLNNNGYHFENVKLFLKGSETAEIGTAVVNTGSGTYDAGKRVKGQIGLHTVANGTLKDITANLYGKAAFHSIETWHAGKNTYNNVNVNLKGEDNSVFLIYPALYDTLLMHTSKVTNAATPSNLSGTYNKRGEFIGNVNVTVPSDATKNIIYNILGAQGSFEIKSSGDYILEGRGNMVYSGYGYSPNYGKLHGESYSTTYDTRTYYTKIGKPSTRDTAGATAAEMVPSINLEKHVQSYGDDNIVLYFANKNTGVANDPYSDPNLREDTGAKSYDSQLAKWKESQVGIYQGEILVNAVIGNQLNVANSGSQAGGNKTGGDKKYVETNVGVFARSGQRSGMKPTDDFGAISIYDKDPVHSLQINNVDIQFGKHSKSGIMFASEYGTVIDVAETGNNHDVIAIMRGIIKDSGSLGGATSAGEISATDSANKAATGTIIAYSNGVWDNTKHNMSSTTANALNGLPSEINIGKDVQMSARYLLTSGTLGTASETGVNPIVYLAKDGGIVNAKGKTDAKGFYSIIGYADGVNANGKISKVDITGDVTAKDEWAAADAATVPYLYRNIGGFAKAGGLVNMAGAVEVNGIGGLATGSGSIVNLNAANNVIKTGRNGGLAAFSGGTVNFGGGKLINKDVENFAGTSVIEEGSHDSTTPFYAAAGSKIDFQNHTTIEMHNGLIVPEINRALYHTTADPSTANADNRYFNMQNVEYDIKTDKVTLGVFRDRTVASGNEVIWNGSSQDLASGLGFNGIINYAASNPNPFVKTVFENADITIDTTSTVPGSNNTNAAINLTASPHTSETFNALSMERSRVTIAATQTINSTGPLASGVQGLSMGSNTSAASNAETAYYNYGTVSNTGGTPAANIAGINVSYGTIENKSGGNVTVNEGAGIYGTNGSKLVNEAGGTITVTTSGAGIAAKVSADPSNLLGYGTDTNSLASSTQNAIEITNEGDIVTAGMANPIGIFAQNNRADSVHRSRVVVNNRNTLTLGDNGVGIIVTAEPAAAGGNPVHGGTVNLRGTGASDIVTGVNGTGVYAQNSDINLLTDYRVETKDDGAGIFVKGTQSSVNGPGKFVYKYNGSATGKGAGLAFGGSLLGETGTVDAKNYVDVDVENTAGTIGGIASIYTTGGGKFTNYGTVNASTVKGYNIIGDGKDEIINEGVLNVAASASTTEPNIGMVVTGSGKAVNNRTITAGDKSVGIYGFDAELGSASVTSIGKEGIGIYSKGGDVSLSVGSTLNVGTDEGVGVYSVGTGQNVYTAGTINLADNSFGFVNAGTGNKVISDSNVALGNKNIYIYSSDAAGQIHNRGNLTGSGNKNYGVYAAGYSENTGNIDLRNGIGNIGMYSKAGDSHNNGGTITVGASGANPEYNPVDALTGTLKDPSKPFDPVSTLYSVGMAAGYLERDPVTNLLKKDSAGNHIVHDQGKITNSGTIEVSGKDSTGMYGAGANTVVTNEAGASINLAADGAIGIFAEEGAKVINKGTIQTTVDGLKDVKGIVLGKNSTLDNQGGKIIIRNADTSVGVLLKGATIINRGTIEVSGGIGSADVQLFTQNSTGKPVSAFPNSIEIDAAPNVTDATITVNGQIVQPEAVKFNIISSPKNVNISSIGIYVDTSGTEYTIPVIGLQNLTKEADLIIGAEAARRTTAKEIVVDDPNIIEPYNESMRSNGKVETWNFYSGSLTWAATATVRDASSSAYPGHVQINKMYLVKKPYTDWAGNEATPINSTDTYNFLDGLEQRYGVEGVGTREKELFDKISGIGNNEEILFFQAVDEMMGHQYGNVQQRINATGNALDKEFGHLKKDWRNPSKQNNKIKVFGMRDEYKTDTAGIIDYTSNTYGVAYVHEDETVKLGNSSGWYAGTVHNRFDFKDIGKSEENQTMIKAGVFKTMSPSKDHNGALRWTIAGDVFAGINEMKRRYLVVDDIFYADSDYYSYGAALKTDLGYDVRLSERTHLRPYGSFKMEYGRFKDIKEKNGEIRLEVDGNDYYSIKPEVGVEFRYIQPMAVKTNLSVGLSAAYETELGKVGDVNNRGRVRFTEADWFGIRGEKEDRRGNGKFDLNIGVDNTRFGVTVNAGYDTKGENIRGGLGFRAIY